MRCCSARSPPGRRGRACTGGCFLALGLVAAVLVLLVAQPPRRAARCRSWRSRQRSPACSPSRWRWPYAALGATWIWDGRGVVTFMRQPPGGAAAVTTPSRSRRAGRARERAPGARDVHLPDRDGDGPLAVRSRTPAALVRPRCWRRIAAGALRQLLAGVRTHSGGSHLPNLYRGARERTRARHPARSRARAFRTRTSCRRSSPAWDRGGAPPARARGPPAPRW